MTLQKDYTGQQIGYLTVVEQVPRPQNKAKGHTYWKCICACGKEFIASNRIFTKSEAPSCGCKSAELKSNSLIKFQNEQIKKKIGLRNNHLVIIGAEKQSGFRGYVYKCRCDCGKEINVRSSNFKDQISCGTCQYKIKNADEVIGKQYQFYTVVGLTPRKGQSNRYLYECKCVCGKTFYRGRSAIVTQRTKSCGCKTQHLQSLALGGTGIPHERTPIINLIRHLPEYRTWQIAIRTKYNRRCVITNKKDRSAETHHIVPLNVLVTQYNITKDNYTDYLDVLYDINNGVLISKRKHKEFHLRYGYQADQYDLMEYARYLQGLS